MSRVSLLRYWGKQWHNSGLGVVLNYLAKMDLLIKLIEVVFFPLFTGNTHIGFRSSVLGCFKLEFGSQLVGTAGKD